jgi:hypothetical protein
MAKRRSPRKAEYRVFVSHADFASTQVVQFDPQSPESAARDIASRLGVV